jgi:hypothetical protein
VASPYSQNTGDAIPELAGQQRTFLMAGAGAAVLSVVGYFTNQTQFFQSYLMAYFLVLGFTLGSLGLFMIHQLSGGAWGVIIRQQLGAAMRVLPIVTILFLPIVFGMHNLYEWTHEDVVAADHILQQKAKWLNSSFFMIRAAVYFAVWTLLAFILNKWSADQERTGDPTISLRMQRVSAAGLLLMAVTVTFAAFDWLMSLSPHWFSTIYGMLIGGGMLLSTMAMQIITLVWLTRRKPLSEAVGAQHFHDLANLMLAFVVLWAYFSFSQYLLIWAGNLPEEITWYHYRSFTSWRFIAMALVFFHFAVPFSLLLSRVIKREPTSIVKVCVAIIAARLIDLFWLTAPEFHHDGLSISWMDIVLPVALIGIWAGTFLGQLRNRALLPIHDPQFDEALALGPVHGQAEAAH